MTGDSLDIVGIFDQSSFAQLFADARPLKATVRETSRVMNHPAETGVTLSDHRIINPVEIDMPLMIASADYDSMYGQIKNAFVNNTLLSVQTRTGVYSNIIIADMPHEESADIYTSIILALHLKEILYVAPTTVAAPNAPANYSPADPENDDTSQNGQQQPASFTGSTGSWDAGATGAW